MSVPAVTVIIPVYNGAATIARALESVFAQSFRDFEVVVIDDGSTDDLDDQLAPFRSRIDLIKQSNRGASAARNSGVSCSRGRLLAFLDADDFWHERKLELQVSAFERRPDIVLCYTDQRHWYPGEPNPYVPIEEGTIPEPTYSSDFNKLFASPYLGTPGVMIPRTRFVELGGFREDLKSAEDVDLWLRCAAFDGTIARIPHPLFYVVVRRGSLTAKRGEGTYRDNLQVIDDFCAAHPDFARTQAQLVRRARAKIYEDWGSGALQRGDSRAAVRLLLSSLRCSIGGRASYLCAKAMARALVRA